MSGIDGTCNEDALLAQKAARDPEVFLSLYDRYFARIYTYFRYRCSDPFTCDDLTSQTFEQALAKIWQYQPERGPFAAWLFGIARNLVNGYLRRNGRFEHLPLDELNSHTPDEPLLEDTLIRNDEQQQLIEAINTLSSRQKDILALKFSGQLNNQRIAAMIGLSEQNVGIIIYRSIRQLRKMLECEETQGD